MSSGSTPRTGPAGASAGRVKTGPTGAKRALVSDKGARVTSYVTGLLLWVLLSVTFARVPNPVEVAVHLYQEIERGEVFGNFSTTLVRFFGGVAVASVIGISIGLLTGLSRMWRAFLDDIVLVGLSIPGIIWAFLTVMWFGLGWKPAVTATILAAVPFVAVNVDKGVRGVSRDLRDMSQAYGVPPARRIRELVLPAVTGYIAAGVRFGVIIGWNVVLLSEWFGASDGVGFRARYWYDANQFGGFAAWVVLFIGFIVLLDRAVLDRIIRKAFAWRDAEEIEQELVEQRAGG